VIDPKFKRKISANEKVRLSLRMEKKSKVSELKKIELKKLKIIGKFKLIRSFKVINIIFCDLGIDIK
tara:strand:- start:5252 stop:5452 length:201 start_codon:yes stop_codon:yes gene_type:complete